MNRLENLKILSWVVGIALPSLVWAGPVNPGQASPGRGNAIQNADVTIAGPGGEVLVFFRDGNDVVIRNCGKDYSSVQKRSDCAAVGSDNRVPVEGFKQVLKSEFQLSDADKLKPLTQDEVKAYRSANVSQLDALKQQEKVLSEKLARIQQFISLNGADDQTQQDQAATQQLLDQARNQLATAKASGDAIQKVNDFVNQVIDKITADGTVASGMHRFSSKKNSDEAMYTLLKQFDASRAECGTDEILNGTRSAPGGDSGAGKATWLEKAFTVPSAMAQAIGVDDRVASCIGLPGAVKTAASGVRWNLVSRKRDSSTGKFYEVWKDSKTGLLWGDRLDSAYSHYNAVELSMTGKVVNEKACANEEGKRASTGIREKSFGLPTIDEFQQAEKDGVREIAPNMPGHFFWSASLYPKWYGWRVGILR